MSHESTEAAAETMSNVKPEAEEISVNPAATAGESTAQGKMQAVPEPAIQGLSPEVSPSSPAPPTPEVVPSTMAAPAPTDRPGPSASTSPTPPPEARPQPAHHDSSTRAAARTNAHDSAASSASTTTSHASHPDPPSPRPDPRAALPALDWDGLEARYEARMAELGRAEDAAYADVDDWLGTFRAWADAGVAREDERGYKRLKTRIAFVRAGERRLRERRVHHGKVVEAFQSALALLGRS